MSHYEPDGRLTFVSDAYAAFFGVTSEELLNKSIYDLITPEEQEGSRRRHDDVTPENPMVAERNKVFLEDGSIRRVDWVTTGFFSPEGELTGYQSVGRDVTVEEALQRSATLAPCAISARSQSRCWMATATPQQTIGTIQEVTDQKLAEKGLRENQLLLQKQITELRESEQYLQDQSRALTGPAESLEATRKELEVANNQKNRLFSIIAYDLKSPFMPLLGFTELLVQAEEEASQETVRDYARSIHSTAQQAHTLLSDLLDWSRLQLDRLTVNPAFLDIHDVAKRHIDQFGPAASAKGIDLSLAEGKNLLCPCGSAYRRHCLAQPSFERHQIHPAWRCCLGHHHGSWPWF